jgi:5-methylcytosine-specific restriction endonuclease McrA
LKIVLLIILLFCVLVAYVYFAPANQRLRDLQNMYRCFQMPRYTHVYYLNSKKQFDNFSIRRKININNLSKIIYKSAHTKQLFTQYQHSTKRLLARYAWYQKPFNSLFIKRQLDTQTWSITWMYTSPKGRNHYEKSIHSSIEDLIPNYLELNNKLDNEVNHFGVSRKMVRQERAKLTDKLRYQVLKRDHYRCVICGRSAKDGVKLHVDHIKPVSRGGKTILSNLRTLCSDCNLGKSASYDPHYKYAR